MRPLTRSGGALLRTGERIPDRLRRADRDAPKTAAIAFAECLRLGEEVLGALLIDLRRHWPGQLEQDVRKHDAVGARRSQPTAFDCGRAGTQVALRCIVELTAIIAIVVFSTALGLVAAHAMLSGLFWLVTPRPKPVLTPITTSEGFVYDRHEVALGSPRS